VNDGLLIEVIHGGHNAIQLASPQAEPIAAQGRYLNSAKFLSASLVGTGQLDTVTYLQAPARHSHKVGSDSKESSDLQHRKGIAIGTDHNVVDRS
jgi:hypothetical protein